MHAARFYGDNELIQSLKNAASMNDVISFMYKEYFGLLESYIVNNSGSKDDAADIIQETMLAFVEIAQQDKYRGKASVKSFLYSITRNLWLAELRKRNSADKRNRVFETAKDDTEQATVAHLIRNEYFKSIQQLLDKLGEKCKELLMLVYYEDLSMSDIMKQMNGFQNEQVLRNKKYKCMKQLEVMISENDELRKQFKNALIYAG